MTRLEDGVRSTVELLCEKLRQHRDRYEVVRRGAAFTAATMDIIMESCNYEWSDMLESASLGQQWLREIVT